MPPRKKRKRTKTVSRKRDPYPRLPGYLLIVFGLICLFINFDLLPGLEWAKAYPLLVVLAGFVSLVKVSISKD